METRIAIQENLAFEKSSIAPVVDSNEVFDKAYDQGLRRNNINLLDSTAEVVGNDDGTFSICSETTDKLGQNKRLREFVKIKNIDLLKKFIYYVVDHNRQSILSSVQNGFNVDVVKSNVKSKEGDYTYVIEGNEIVIREELVQLKEEISSQWIIDDAKALSTGGIFHFPDGTTKVMPIGTYPALLHFMKTSIAEKDKVIYKQNLKILGQIADENNQKVTRIREQAKDLMAQEMVTGFSSSNNEIRAGWKGELDRILAQYDSMKKYVANNGYMNKPFDASIYTTDIVVYSDDDIQKLQKKIGAQDAENRKINEGMFNTALLKLDDDDRQEFRTYLNGVITGDNKNPAQKKYKAKHAQDFKEICKDYPFLTGYIDFSAEVDKDSYVPDVQNNVVGGGQRNQSNAGKDSDNDDAGDNTNGSTDYATMTEAFKKRGAPGVADYLLDKTKMRPEHRQILGVVGNLALTTGAIILGVKMLKSAFNLLTNKDKENPAEKVKSRMWLTAPFILMFGAQALTGQGPLGLLKGGPLPEKIAGIRDGSMWNKGKKKKNQDNEKEEYAGGGYGGDANGGEENPMTEEEKKKSTEIKNTYGEGFPGITAIFHGKNYGEIKKFTEKDSEGKIKIKDDAYAAILNVMRNKTRNKVGEKFLMSIGKSDDNHIIDLAFNGMGITRDALNDTNNADKPFDDAASLSIVKLQSVSAYMQEHEYSRIDPGQFDKIQAYIADEDAKLSDLEKLDEKEHVFLKERTIQLEPELATFEDKIKILAKDSEHKKEALIIGLNKFYRDMPNAAKDIGIEIEGAGPVIKFQTYKHKVELNIDKKQLIGFTPSRFSNYAELFRAASLTNWIQDLCKDKSDGGITDPKIGPFKVGVSGDIVWKEPDEFSLNTSIVDAGRICSTLKKVSPTINENDTSKAAYCEYLNILRKRGGIIEFPELDRGTFDSNTSTLKLENKEVKVTIESKLGTERQAIKLGDNYFQDIDQPLFNELKIMLQGLDVGNSTSKVVYGKKVSMERLA